MIYKIKPKPGCKYCHGTGDVYDAVPYGSTTAWLPSLCDCVCDQIPEDFDDRHDDIEVDLDDTIFGGD